MYEFLEYRVEHVMTRHPLTIDRHTRLSEIGTIFARNNFNALPVVEHGDRLVGVVTKLDLLKAFLFSPKSLIPPYQEIVRQPAERAITWDPATVQPDEPLTKVLQKMVHTRCKSFPVVTGHRLVGIITREDVIRGLRLAAEGKRPDGFSSAVA